MKQHGLVSFLIYAIGLPVFHKFIFPMFETSSGLNPERICRFFVIRFRINHHSLGVEAETAYGFESVFCLESRVLFL